MSSVLAHARRLLRRNDSLLWHTVIMLAASSGGGLLNYVYQILMGRMLGPDEYGVLCALLSILYIVSVPAQTLQVTATRTTAFLVEQGGRDSIGLAVRRMTKWAGLLALVGLGLSLVCSRGLAGFLRTKSVTPAIMLGIAASCQLLVPPFNGALQGCQWFGRLAIAQIGGFVAKLLVAAGLVILGLGVNGAIAGIALGSMCTLGLALWFLRDVVARHGTAQELPATPVYSVLAFLTVGLLTLLYNTDVILAKRFLTAEQAGQYSAATTLAKALFFAAAASGGVLFPKLSQDRRGATDIRNRAMLKSTLAIAIIMSGAGALILNLFGRFLVTSMFGSQYGEAGGIVGLCAVTFALFTAVYVLAYYHLALARRGVLAILTTGLALQVIGIAMAHGSARGIVLVVLGSMAAESAMMLVYTAWPRGNRGIEA